MRRKAIVASCYPERQLIDSSRVEVLTTDGGARKHRLMAAESRRREAQNENTDKQDHATREVWSAYIAFRTAIRKEQAAVALLESANASYSASLDAYRYEPAGTRLIFPV
jgi:outer membrane protein